MLFTNVWLANAFYFVMVPSSGTLVQQWNPWVGSGSWNALGSAPGVVYSKSAARPALAFEGSPPEQMASNDGTLCGTTGVALFAINFPTGSGASDQGIAACHADADNFVSFRTDNAQPRRIRYRRVEFGRVLIDVTSRHSYPEGSRTYVGFKTAANGTVTLITVGANGSLREETSRSWFFDPIAGTARLGWTSDAGSLVGDLEAVATRPGATMSAAEINDDRRAIEAKLAARSKF